ncbi:MAG: iron ABC transporter ATP-binding protein [Bacteroidetes bacterium 4484_276]|nr:MAG: iron ABC transporter ATP-binding protein [Bacteroidetes bacterium 4484_276]OYT14355.1 MAG: iron ABC transporter ATP-binding protein [Bacteroidetes bacterium 4572_114]
MVKIKIENMSFAYRKVPVLKNLDIKIRAGQLTAIIGPNGSGKSTLLKCINGILPVKKGEILVDEKSTVSFTRRHLATIMAYVPQQETQVFSGTVYETILMGRKPYIGWSQKPEDYEIINQVMNDLDLNSISSEFLNELSGGQRQRVLIGRALAQQPEILLLDEPTANLDLKHQLEVMQILKDLSHKGITVILAIHDLNMAAKYCNELIMLDKGKTFATGDRSILDENNIKSLYEVEVKILGYGNDNIIIPLKAIK